MNETLPSELAEGAEAAFMYEYGQGTPAAARDLLGIATGRMGGGTLLSMQHDPTGYWNKALGFTETVTGELVDRVLEHYQSASAPQAVLQFAPSTLPADWGEIASNRSLSARNQIVKLACPIQSFSPHGGTRLRVAPVGKEDADEWASVILQTFGMPTDGLGAMFTATVGHPDFRPFAVWDGSRIVAGANLYLHESGVGALHAGATLPSHRGMGAQSALITARAVVAQEAGCRWLVAETAHPDPGQHNPSLANMLRAGCVQQYLRQNWLWRNPSHGIEE